MDELFRIESEPPRHLTAEELRDMLAMAHPNVSWNAVEIVLNPARLQGLRSASHIPQEDAG